MKITFLGASAAKNYPALWCHCAHCEYAREHGGRMSWASFLWIFGSASVYEALAAHSRIRMDILKDYRMSFTKICAGERFEPLPELLVTLVLSCYGTQGNSSGICLIELSVIHHRAGYRRGKKHCCYHKGQTGGDGVGKTCHQGTENHPH